MERRELLKGLTMAAGATLCPGLVINSPVLTRVLGARAQESNALHGSSVWNNNSLINIQKRGGDPRSPGDVRIAFYGHDAFKITSPHGVTVLVDPWGNDTTGQNSPWFLGEFPPLQVDIVLSTHAHFDHDAVHVPNGLMVLERLIGQFRLGDVEITGLGDKHVCQPTPESSSVSVSSSAPIETCPPDNVIGFDNAIQIVLTGGLRIAVWGDNRAVPAPSLDAYLSNVDVLILPVESVLSSAEANAIISKYAPRAVIPSHYFVKGLTAKGSGLVSADGWVSTQENAHRADVIRLDRSELTLRTADLRSSPHRMIYYFGDHFDQHPL
jgi:L-ascorbate metabolism protein UlaG (beta-lactamase superfamily)